jgi:predicted DNA-binding protein (UPF0251 family)
VARPKSERFVHTPPLFNAFKPIGISGRNLETLEMSLDEYEALRLADFEGMNQDEASEEMEISRSTFARLIEAARKKSAQFFIDGKRLTIGGGPVHFKKNILQCRDCRSIFELGMNEKMAVCVSCGSLNLIDLAGGFGHGRCCRRDFGSRTDSRN